MTENNGYKLSMANFQGTVLNELKNIKEGVNEIKLHNEKQDDRIRDVEMIADRTKTKAGVIAGVISFTITVIGIIAAIVFG